MLRQLRNNQRAQVFLEYAMVIGAVIAILFAMNTLIKRGTQSMIKGVADQLGVQENSDQPFNLYQDGLYPGGHMENSYTSARSDMDKTRDEFFGNIQYRYQDAITMDSLTQSNLGYAPNP